MGLGTGSDICSHTSGSLAAPAFCRQLNSHCCIPAGGASDLEAPIVSSRQTRTNVFLYFFPSHSLHSIVQMLMIHPWGNIYSRCRFLLCEWRFSFLPLRRDRAQPTPRDSPDNIFYLSVSPMWRHQLPLFLSLKTHLSASTHFSAAPFKQSSVLNHLYSELYLDTFLSCWSQSFPLAHFSSRLQQGCSNNTYNSVQQVWGRDSCEMTYDLLSLIRGNWHVIWMMKTSMWSGCFCTVECGWRM